jgi:hypothetical protein
MIFKKKNTQEVQKPKYRVTFKNLHTEQLETHDLVNMPHQIFYMYENKEGLSELLQVVCFAPIE